MDPALIRQVWLRARACCEYCRTPQEYDKFTFEIDHIIARKHGGAAVARNLALSGFSCNSFKGSDLGGLDPRTRKLTPLYNPRRDKWGRHFRWDGPFLRGRTPVGRVTVALLHINDPLRVALRAGLIKQDAFPPAT